MCSILIAVLLALSAQVPREPPLSEARFVGNSRARSEELLEAIGFKQGFPGGPASMDKAVNDILSFYRDRGYLFASVRAETEGSGDSALAVFTIVEGPRFTLGRVRVEGNESLPATAIQSQMDTRPGRVFDQSVFRRDMERVLALYENSGRAFVQVMPEAVSYDTLKNEVELTLRVVEGPLVRLAGARVLGARVSRPDYLAREAGIKEGDAYSRSKLENGTRRLSKLPFITGVEEFRLARSQRDEWVWAETTVREGRANRLDGVLGVEPGEAGGATGMVNVDLANLAGTGRAIRARWQRTAPVTSSLSLSYREPFILSYDLAAEASFDHQIRDTSFTKSRLVVEVSTRAAGALSLSWGLSLERILPGSLPLARSTSYGVRAGLSIDTRRRPETGEAGILYDIRVEYALRDKYSSALLPEPEPRASVGQLVFDFAHYVPVPVGRELLVSVHGREAYTSETSVPVHDYFLLGGAGSVRGYREEQFSGSRVLWVNLEHRFCLIRDSFLYPFVDVGYYQSNESASLVGYGVGVSLRAAAGSLGLDYGIGKDDGPLDGKVHLRLASEF